MISSDQMARLVAVGITPEQLIVVTAVMEERDAVTARVTLATASAAAPRSKEAERSKRYREKQKALKRDGKRDGVTVAVTGETMKEGGTLSQPLKISQEKKEKEGLPVTDAREAPTKKRGLTFLPDNFVADDTVEKVLDYFHLTGDERTLCLDEIRDFWRGSGRMMKDWQAVFRNGVKRYVRVNRKGSGNGTGRKYNEPRGMEAFANFSAKVDAKLREAARAADGESQGSGGPVIVELPFRSPRQGR